MFREVEAVSKAESIKKNEDNRRKKSSKEMNSQPAARMVLPVNQSPTRYEDAMQETGEIPKFNLAEQIMAEQRKITAIRRKGPGKMAKPPQKQHPAESIGRNVMPMPILSGPEQIISEIVARDIEELCVGNTSRF